MNLGLSASFLGGVRLAFSGRAIRSFLALFAGVALLPANGCLGHHYVKTDFKAYENAFAETSNREMLLNLARLQDRDPAYFFKMGQITSSYRMQGSLTTSGQLSAVTAPEGQVPTGGGTPGVIFENDPTFQYIPVNDDTNARLLMEPIQPETFYALYQQGWRMDQLFRLLVDRIEVSQTDKNGVCTVETFRNLPPAGAPYDAVALSHYATFLRVSALVYELQKSGILVLRGTSTFVPYDSKGAIPVSPDKSSPPDDSWSAGNGGEAGRSGNGGAFQAKDQNDAVARNDIWEQTADKKGWVLGHKVFSAVFYLSPIHVQTDPKTGVTTYSSKPDDVRDELEKSLGPDEDWDALKTGTALNNMLKVMSGGFSLEGTPNPVQAEQQDVCPAAGAPPAAHLYMRSIIELMAASAQEEEPFEELIQSDPVVPDDPQNPDPKYVPGTFTAKVPRIEQIPVLRLQWITQDPDGHWKDVDPDNLKSPLVTVVYRDITYKVTDEKPDASPPPLAANQNWNRDMFRLIEGLSSQVTVDISKFPLPEILQLHSD